MEAYRAGATGNSVLEKTRELKKSHRVPLVIDQPAKVNYARSRGRRLLSNLVGNQDEAGERREVVFDQESFATKICQMDFANNPRRRFERIGELMRVRTREAPRSDFLEGFGGQLFFDKLVEDHRWDMAMADEWGGATAVTCNDEEEWRAMWRGHREQMDSENVRQDNGDEKSEE